MRKSHFLSIMCLVSACGISDRTESEMKFRTGAANFRGHEDITRYGVERANVEIGLKLGIANYYSEVGKGVSGIDTDNSLIKGNFETDFPEKRMFDFHGESGIIPGERWVAWHESPKHQHLHGLRNSINGQVLDSFITCRQVSGAIENAVNESLKYLRKDRHNSNGNYWVGHATHIIQDTFSKAHTRRDGSQLKQLTDHCSYGKEFPGVCLHKENDENDVVWKQDGGSCEFDTNNRNWACLKDEAKAAAQATAGLLKAVADLTSDPTMNVKNTLQDLFFQGNERFHSGYLDCRMIGLKTLNEYFKSIAGKQLSEAESSLLLKKLAYSEILDLKNYLFDKYSGSILQEMTGITLDEPFLKIYTDFLRVNGYTKTSDHIYSDDASELIKYRFEKITGRAVELIWIPRYISFVSMKKSLAELDKEIQRQTTVPQVILQPNPPPVVVDPCLDLKIPLEIIKCRTSHLRS